MEQTPSLSTDESTAGQEAENYVATDIIMPFFSDSNMNITAILVLVPLALWTLKSTYSLYVNVPSAGLKAPAILIFIAPLLLQVCNLISIQVESEHGLAMIALVAKIFITVLLCSFYFMIREVVFYEHLLQQTEAMNADAAFSETGTVSAMTTQSSQVSGGVFSLVPREVIGAPNNARRSALREQLMAVNYDQALAEEKILNQVYPSYELQHNTMHNEHSGDNKQAVLNTEIFEIGKVARCFACASEETFDSIEAADQFRSNTVRAFVFFGTLTCLKTITEFILRRFYQEDIQSTAVLIFPALDLFETLFTVYTLYCIFLLCACLAQGLIYEYQPVAKFALVAIMALMAVSQDFIIYCILGMFPPVEDNQVFPATQQSELAVRINSFLVSIEVIFLIVFVNRHFQISSGQNNQLLTNEDAYTSEPGVVLNTILSDQSLNKHQLK